MKEGEQEVKQVVDYHLDDLDHEAEGDRKSGQDDQEGEDGDEVSTESWTFLTAWWWDQEVTSRRPGVENKESNKDGLKLVMA